MVVDVTVEALNVRPNMYLLVEEQHQREQEGLIPKRNGRKHKVCMRVKMAVRDQHMLELARKVSFQVTHP